MPSKRRPNKIKATAMFSREYLAGLEDFWAGRPRTALEHISKLLADNPEDPEIFAMYRMWLEVLANEEDLSALRSLENHLALRADSEPQNRSIYAALRGIIYFELDQIEAVELTIRAGQKEKYSNTYFEELKQVYAQRLADSPPTTMLSLAKSGQLQDYFHWQTLARNCFMLDDQKNLHWVLQQTSSIFPHCPLSEMFDLHMNLESKNYSKAASLAHNLNKHNPGVIDFQLINAYASLQNEETDVAVQQLTKLNQIVGDRDPDVLVLLGKAYSTKHQNASDNRFLDRANAYLRRAAEYAREMGFPTADIAQMQAQLADPEAEPSENREPKLWLVKLSARRTHELQTTPEDQITYLQRPMGQEPQPGDMVFMMGDDYRNDEHNTSWRLIATYKVITPATWHPEHRFLNTLQLKNRYEVSVPIDVHSFHHFQPNQKNSKKPAVAGLFQLDVAGLEAISQQITDYLGVAVSQQSLIS